MSDHRILNAAKDFMLVYLGDGRVRRPTDFDQEILGTSLKTPGLLGAADILLRRSPPWQATVFCKALGALVDAGRVRAWQNDEGEWFYQMTGVPVQ